MPKDRRNLTYTDVKDFKLVKKYKKNNKNRLEVSFIGMKNKVIIPGIVTEVYYNESGNGMTIVVKD